MWVETLFLNPVWLVDQVHAGTGKAAQITGLSGTSEELEDNSLY